MKHISAILFFILVIISSSSAEEDVTIQTDVGPLEVTKSKVPENFKQDIRELTKDELDWLSKENIKAESIVSHYLGKSKKIKITPKYLDIAYSAWAKDNSKDKVSPVTVIQAFGAALGLYVAEREKTEWKIVNDVYGTDIALIFTKTGVQTYPISSVAKRVERGEENYFVPLYKFIKEFGNRKK